MTSITITLNSLNLKFGIFFAITYTMTQKELSLKQSTLDTLKHIENIPTLPELFLRIQEVLNDPSSSLSDLTKVIEKDQATSATIVKIANSSYYNPLGKPASSLSFAISRLGRREASSVALSMALLYGFSIPAGIDLIRRFWAHAFAVGQVCRQLKPYTPAPQDIDEDILFLSGLLHDIGRAVLGICIDPHYFEQDLAKLHGSALTEAEIHTYGIDHAEVGKIMLNQWGINSIVSDLVGHHHQSNSLSVNHKIIALADQLTHQHLSQVSDIEDVEKNINSESFQQILHDTFAKDEHPFS